MSTSMMPKRVMDPAMMPIFAPCGKAAQRLRTPEGDWISSRTLDLPPLMWVSMCSNL